MIKTINYRNTTIKLSGNDSDPYFNNIDATSRDLKFFIYCIEHCLSADSIAIDVGANLGLTSAMMATIIKGGRIVSVEPSPTIFPILLQNMASNGLANVLPVQLALSSQTGSVDFYDNPTSASASHISFTNTLGGRTTTVKAVTLDELAAELSLPRIDLIKIDVEGFELDVLKGASGVLQRNRPSVFVEFNAFTLIAFGNVNPRHVLEKLLETFSHVYRFKSGKPQRIHDDGSALAFLHKILVRAGGVEDLFCRFEPLAVP